MILGAKIGKSFSIAPLVFSFTICLVGCDEPSSSDGDNEEPCAPEFCNAWCLESCVDAGIAPWGGCEGVCVDDYGCTCDEYLCIPDNCEAWCQEVQGLSSGYCSGLNCNCV